MSHLRLLLLLTTAASALAAGDGGRALTARDEDEVSSKAELLTCMSLCLGMTEPEPARQQCWYSERMLRGSKKQLQLLAPCKNLICVVPTDCIKQPNLFTNEGLLNVSKVGGRLVTVCGNAYYFSNTTVTFAGAQRSCCNLGMKLASPNTLEESNCLSLWGKANPLEETFWFSATRKDSQQLLCWCGINEDIKAAVKWRVMPGERDQQTEQCLSGRFTSNNLLFEKSDCKENNYYVCQLPATTESPRCVSSTCVKNRCIYDVTKAVQDDAMLLTLGFTKVIRACEMSFTSNDVPVPYSSAKLACCNLNMRLLTVASTDKLKCLIEQKVVKKKQNAWVDASDVGCKSKFTWCDSGDLLASTSPWLPDSPSNTSDERCVIVRSSAGTFGLKEHHCEKKSEFICEI